MSRKYNYTGNSSFENALYDCNLVDESIVDEESFQQADTGLVLYYMDRILEALRKQVSAKVKIYDDEILICPCCNEELGYYKTSGIGYCIDCGQKIEFVE